MESHGHIERAILHCSTSSEVTCSYWMCHIIIFYNQVESHGCVKCAILYYHNWVKYFCITFHVGIISSSSLSLLIFINNQNNLYLFHLCDITYSLHIFALLCPLWSTHVKTQEESKNEPLLYMDQISFWNVWHLLFMLVENEYILWNACSWNVHIHLKVVENCNGEIWMPMLITI